MDVDKARCDDESSSVNELLSLYVIACYSRNLTLSNTNIGHTIGLRLRVHDPTIHNNRIVYFRAVALGLR
jgi:hypothetical protein